jgi:hypothetical protein
VRTALSLVVALSVLVVAARDARAQACCVATGLTTPARLRVDEQLAIGLQTRVRTVVGAFGPDGSYAATPDGNRELGGEEDLLAAARLGSRLQVALQVPFVQTSRRVATPGAPALTDWGGGLGDVAVSGRWEPLRPDERGLGWPGLALLVGVSAPTGRPADQAGDPLAASATGIGSWRGEVGIAVEAVVRRLFVTGTLSVAQRTGRTVGQPPTVVRQSFAPQLTAALVGGYALSGGATVGAFAVTTRQGNGRDGNGEIAGSGLALFTAGLAGALPLADGWRLQAALAGDLPADGLGRNQTAGLAFTAALIRAWR